MRAKGWQGVNGVFREQRVAGFDRSKGPRQEENKRFKMQTPLELQKHLTIVTVLFY